MPSTPGVLGVGLGVIDYSGAPGAIDLLVEYTQQRGGVAHVPIIVTDD